MILHFGEWESRRVFHVAMRAPPKKNDLYGFVFVGFKTGRVGALHQVCRVRGVTHRNIGGNLRITVSLESELKTPFAHIPAQSCYVIFV